MSEPTAPSFARIAELSGAVGATAGRSAKIDLLAGGLRALDPGELAAGVAFLAGQPRQRQLGAGHAALRDLPPAAESPSLSIADVDAAFARMEAAAGAGSDGERRALLRSLFARATAPEQRLLAGLVGGELHQGAAGGLVEVAVARAAGVDQVALRRALMLAGDLPAIAVLAMSEGAVGLARVRLEIGRPLLPMLAATASDLASGFDRLGEAAAVEWKLDGARIQIHRDGGDVAVFTRSLEEITGRVPELVSAALALPVSRAVLDGEAIVLRDGGRPAPFAVTSSRIGSRSDRNRPAGRSLVPMLFDLLHLDGEDLLDRPGAERSAALAGLAPAELVVPRLAGARLAAAEEFLAEALNQGHEGVMLKDPAQPYLAGRRSTGWLKVKPVHTLDLIVLAAEWGHGRRRGRLSNLHLGARDPAGGQVMLGKTFKGLTDELLAWQTARLLELETRRDRVTVYVRPELVVEVAFDGVQGSSRYPGGVTLRFARVRGYRPDRSAADADTIDAVRALRRE